MQAGTKAIGFYVKAKATENWNTGLRGQLGQYRAGLASMISPQRPPHPPTKRQCGRQAGGSLRLAD